MLVYLRARRTYTRMADLYIALASFARESFNAGARVPEQILVKPKLLIGEPGLGTGAGGHALFVGRLSLEKGFRILLDAWKLVRNRVKHRIAGNGPLLGEAQHVASGSDSIEILGRLSKQSVAEGM